MRAKHALPSELPPTGLCEAPPAEREASGGLPEEGVSICWGLGLSPLSRAEHRHGGRNKRADLSERSEFPRAPTDGATRRIKRDAGVFFWFVFLHVQENEQTYKDQTLPRIGNTSPHPPPEVAGLNRNYGSEQSRGSSPNRNLRQCCASTIRPLSGSGHSIHNCCKKAVAS